MARYIDADRFAERIKLSPAFKNMAFEGDLLQRVVLDLLDNAPTAEVEEVKPGEWIKIGKTKGGSNILKCSVCSKVRKGVGKSAYCRDCGAEMGGKRKVSD